MAEKSDEMDECDSAISKFLRKVLGMKSSKKSQDSRGTGDGAESLPPMEPYPAQNNLTKDVFDNKPSHGPSSRFHEEGGEPEYRMNSPLRGLLIIISNEEFDEHEVHVPGKPPVRVQPVRRAGTCRDEQRLHETFTRLGFQDTLVFRNQTEVQMIQLIITLATSKNAAEWYGVCDCLAIVILTHGQDGFLYGTTGQVDINRLLNPLKQPERNRTLNGIPKICFVQACLNEERLSEEEDDGESAASAEKGTRRIPLEADFLYSECYAPDCYSDENGSVYIDKLCNILDQFGSTTSLVRLMTRVNHQVMEKYRSLGMSYIPKYTSTLTKELVFRPRT